MSDVTSHEARLTPARLVFKTLGQEPDHGPAREVREQLKLKPGDTLRYRITADGILLDKATDTGDDRFAAFSEWMSEADEKAYGDL